MAATTIGAPYIAKAQSPIRWRLQTYAGVALAEHVIKPSIDAFNKAANGEMVIELYTADQLVPRRAVQAVQAGTIDAAQSDDDSMAAPVDVAVFAAYFPFASGSLDVPVLWHWYGLKEIWQEAYGEVEGVTWLSTGAWDPCNFATTKPIHRSRISRGCACTCSRPAAGSCSSSASSRSLPYEDVEVPCRPASWMAWRGAASPRPTRSGGPT